VFSDNLQNVQPSLSFTVTVSAGTVSKLRTYAVGPNVTTALANNDSTFKLFLRGLHWALYRFSWGVQSNTFGTADWYNNSVTPHARLVGQLPLRVQCLASSLEHNVGHYRFITLMWFALTPTSCASVCSLKPPWLTTWTEPLA